MGDSEGTKDRLKLDIGKDSTKNEALADSTNLSI